MFAGDVSQKVKLLSSKLFSPIFSSEWSVWGIVEMSKSCIDKSSDDARTYFVRDKKLAEMFTW